MSPFAQAAECHARLGCGMEFWEVIEAHAQVGYVVMTPELFMLGRRVDRDWGEDERLDPWVTAETGDCWHVWLLAGDWRCWERFLPYPLEWVSMHRRGRLVVRKLDQFRRLK